jgi:hypothetical protein
MIYESPFTWPVPWGKKALFKVLGIHIDVYILIHENKIETPKWSIVS